MPGSSSTSFIPKRNPTRKERQGVKRQVFVGTFIIRTLFFAVLIAAVGVYFYKAKLNTDLENEIVSFDTAIGKFDVQEMDKILETDLRLTQANNRLMNSTSIVSLLQSLEQSTIGASKLKELSLERVDDTTLDVEAQIETGTFDSVMFQRSVFNDSDTLAVSEIKDLTLQNVPPDNPIYQESKSVNEGEVAVSFTAVLSVNPENIHHLPAPVSGGASSVQNQPVFESESTYVSASSTDEVPKVNETEI